MRTRVGAGVLLSLGLLIAGGCGGDDDAGSVVRDVVDDLSADAGGDSIGEIDLTIPGLDEVELEEAPGRIRFVSLLHESGAEPTLDIYWGGPLAVADSEPAATIEYGVVSDYLTPMRVSSALFPSGDISFTATRSGTEEVVFSWDRFLPDDISRLVMLFHNETDGTVYMSDVDEAQPNFTEFPEPAAGQVTISYLALGTSLMGADLPLGMQGDGRCLSLGTNVLDENGRQMPGDVRSVTVPAGIEIALHDTELTIAEGESDPHFECIGEPVSNSVTAPAGGRAMVIATTGSDGGPALVLVPVE
jgi:hypothetical protein